MSTASISIPFAIGETVWWVGHQCRAEWIVCPDCAGTRAITMILGNGEQVTLDCKECGRGYEPPRGRVERTIFERRPTRFTPEKVRIDGDEFYYTSDVGYAKSTELFHDESECKELCDQMNKEYTESEYTRLFNVNRSNRSSMAHSASYWRRQVSDLEHKLELARARINRIKGEKKP